MRRFIRCEAIQNFLNLNFSSNLISEYQTIFVRLKIKLIAGAAIHSLRSNSKLPKFEL